MASDFVRIRKYICGSYTFIIVLALYGLYTYHGFLRNGGLQERPLLAHVPKGRIKRNSLSLSSHSIHARHTTGHNDSWVCLPDERLSRLHQSCKRHSEHFKNTAVHFGSQFIVDDQRKIIYCQVPHVGSSSIKSAIKDVNLNNTNHAKTHVEQSWLKGHWSHGLEPHGLSHMTRLLPRYNNYKKFLLVRNPFDRIVSVYNNILMSSHKMSVPSENYLKQHYSKNLTQLTFEQFISFLTDKNVPTDVLNNPHWKPITDICFPCHIAYNKILKLETFDHDKVHLTNIGINTHVPHLSRSSRASMDTDGSRQLQKYYGISMEKVALLKRRYRLDMDIFGYSFDVVHSSAKCHPSATTIQTVDNGRKCC